MVKREYDNALVILSAICALAPDDIKSYLKAIKASLELGFFTRADSICNQALAKFPEEEDLHIQFGEIAMRKRDFAEAIKRWDIAREKFPYQPAPYARAAWANAQLGEYEKAEQLAIQGQEKATEWPDCWTINAEIAMRRRDFTEASRRWNIVRERFPRVPAGYARAAWTYVEMGEYEKAEQLAIQGQEKTSEWPDSWTINAEIAMRRRDFTEASRRWNIVRERFPRVPAGYARAAWTYVEMGEYEKAEQIVTEGQRQAPYNADVWSIQAEIAIKNRDFIVALGRLRIVIEKFPMISSPYIRMAETYMEMAEYEDALRTCKELLNQMPFSPDGLRMQGEIAMRQRNFKEALEIWREFRNNYPYMPAGYARGAWAYAELGYYLDAEKLALEGQKNIPYWPDSWNAYAEISMYRHDYREAVKRWAKVRDNFPVNYSGYNRAASAWLELGNIEHAKELIMEGLARNPYQFEGYILLSDISSRTLDYENAKCYIESAKMLYPANGQVLAKLASIELLTRHPSKAKEIAADGCKKAPGSFDAHWSQYRQYNANDRIGKLKYLNMMIEKFPTFGVLYQHKAKMAEDKDEAISICLEGTKKALNSFDPLIELASIYLASSDVEKEGNILSILYERFKGKIIVHEYLGKNLLSKKDYLNAYLMLEKSINLFPSSQRLFELYIRCTHRAIKTKVISSKESARLITLLYNQFNLLIHSNPKIFTLFINICSFLINEYPILKSIRHQLLYSLYDRKAYFSSLKSPNKICFICLTHELTFWSEVIKNLPADKVDLIITQKDCNTDEVLIRLGLTNRNISYDIHAVKDYDVIICDALFLKSKLLLPSQRIISLFHSLDGTPTPFSLERSHCHILSTKKHTEYGTINLHQGDLPIIENIPPNIKCELAYTGPYHAAHLRNLSKEDCRKKLKEEYGWEIDDSQPLVYMLEDEFSHFGQNIYCANKLSEFCTVILKTWVSYSSPLLNHLSPKVILLATPQMSNNIIRFASDYMMSGFISGSMISSIMFGSIAIPYYSKYVGSKMVKGAKKSYYTDYLPKIENMNTEATLSPQQILLNMLETEGFFHNLLDIKRLKESILTDTYRNKFIKALPYMRKNIFGHYHLENPAQMTADYIMDFATNGTLGKNCSAIYLKR